jgi:hypothetical protein
MKRRAFTLLAVLFGGSLLAACQIVRTGVPEPPRVTPRPPLSAPPVAAACVRNADGSAALSEALLAFLANEPTPVDFRIRYPGIVLILPGDASTREFRSDCSRFFADVNDSGRIVGGSFG